MVMQQGARAICVHHQCAAGEVRRNRGAEKTICAGIEQLNHLRAGRLLVGATGKVEREQLGAEFVAGHAVNLPRNP